MTWILNMTKKVLAEKLSEGSQPIHIAIADDHAMMRSGIISLLHSKEKFKVLIEAGNGMELLSKITNANPLPSICILDIHMPVLDGYDTLKELRHRWPEIKVLTLTMFDNEFSILKMLRNGALGYVSKESVADTLFDAIEHIYNDGVYYPNSISKKLSLKNTRQSLSEKEILLLSYCCSEMTYKEIADKMNLSKRTVEEYSNNISLKLNLRSRIGLALYALQAGFGSFNIPKVPINKRPLN